MSDFPHVVCVMVTGYKKDRIPMAKNAIKMFLKQSYVNKSLLILNDGKKIDYKHDLITEVNIPKQHNLGRLRNLCLKITKNNWVCQWDDDDIYQLDKVEKQVQFLIKNNVNICTFRNSIVFSTTKNCAGYYSSDRKFGIEGTILHKPTKHRYPEISKGEDTEFLKKFKKVKVINNNPEENIKIYHGFNVWDEFKIMGNLVTKFNSLNITEYHKQLLIENLKEWNIDYQIFKPQEILDQWHQSIQT